MSEYKKNTVSPNAKKGDVIWKVSINGIERHVVKKKTSVGWS
jgi:hypothetical protein